MSTLAQAKKDLNSHGNPEKALFLKRFFKTGRGEYAESDVLIGVNVPVTRIVAKKHLNLRLNDVLRLLTSKVHEERLMALFILVSQYNKADEGVKAKIFKEYLKLVPKYVNNWDLVDSSAHLIVGKYLENKPRNVLYKLAKSKNLWEKRVAIIATAHFIRLKDFKDTLKIAEILLHGTHDLIHKAVGWMLREVGNRDQKVERKFLDKFAHVMPRTMLRYAIEKFPEPIRKKYLNLKK